MNELIPILIISLTAGCFFTYKVIKGIIQYRDYRYGKMTKAQVKKIEWIDTPIMRFSYLYPKKQLRISYLFVLDDTIYEKDDDDIHFRYKQGNHNLIPKEGDVINVFVPKSKNPNKVTINKTEDTIKPIIGIVFLAILSFGIATLVIYNW